VPDTLVVCYHAISETWPAPLAITPGQLEEQLRHLLTRGYRAVTFSEAVAGAAGGRTLAVTFDDAYRSTKELGLPILDRLGIPGTVFVPTSYVGSREPMAWAGIDHWVGGPHQHELTCMDAGELLALQNAGWEIGSHTESHPRLPELAGARLAEELSGSRRRIEALTGGPCRSIAYPYGATGPAVARAAREAGYRAGATLRADRSEEDPLLWPRVGVYRKDPLWRFRLKTAALVRGLGVARLRHVARTRGRGR
jgi:peptidoglycan/xylan/chitin deacetylase (PgdA/CDA1 family)